ncbi:hypothetical protein C8J57DRAFT_177931 [Mycena rebaudengoi]|nr:hypothetical protein C8J57DRAFT_181546 [Mycena rebaudengoi]KAJ7231933.1 hypothetical protein C8J57DRAFT_177931 [Mycena rebaudengoi]
MAKRSPESWHSDPIDTNDPSWTRFHEPAERNHRLYLENHERSEPSDHPDSYDFMNTHLQETTRHPRLYLEDQEASDTNSPQYDVPPHFDWEPPHLPFYTSASPYDPDLASSPRTEYHSGSNRPLDYSWREVPAPFEASNVASPYLSSSYSDSSHSSSFPSPVPSYFGSAPTSSPPNILDDATFITECSHCHTPLASLCYHSAARSKQLCDACGRNPTRTRRSSHKECSRCHATVSPAWRRDPVTKKQLCNACGLRSNKRQPTKESVPSSAEQT